MRKTRLKAQPSRSSRLLSPTSVQALHAPVFRVSADYTALDSASAGAVDYRGAQLRHVDVCQFDGVGSYGRERTSRHIREDARDDYILTMPLRSRFEYSQDGISGTLEPDTFAFYSAAVPLTEAIYALSSKERFSALHLLVSGNMLRYRMPLADEYCGHPIAIRSGATRILRSLCEMIVAEGASLSQSQRDHFGSIVIDAIACAAGEAPELTSMDAHHVSPSHLVVLRKARAFVSLNLWNPSLSIELIAGHCGVSKRYLQDCFCSVDKTVTGTIRELRLQRCQADLRNQSLRKRSISQIARAWGFNDLPYFCRAYRARFGVTPREDRNAGELLKGRLAGP